MVVTDHMVLRYPLVLPRYYPGTQVPRYYPGTQVLPRYPGTQVLPRYYPALASQGASPPCQGSSQVHTGQVELVVAAVVV